MSIEKYGMQPVKIRRADEGKEVWKAAEQTGQLPPQSKHNAQTLQDTAKQKQFAALKQMRNVQATNATNSTSGIRKVDRADRYSGFDDDDYVDSVDAAGNAITFDMNEDIHAFCRPKFISNQLFERDNIRDLAQNVRDKLLLLEDGQDKDRLMRKAELLLNEEVYAKSLVLTYRNALIFS